MRLYNEYLEQAADAVVKARRQIDVHGWLQGARVGQDGEVCMAEAIWRGVNETMGRKAVSDNRRTIEGSLALTAAGIANMYKTIADIVVLETHDGPIPSWNDQPGRTKEEVVAVLVRTEQRLRAKIRIQLPRKKVEVPCADTPPMPVRSSQSRPTRSKRRTTNSSSPKKRAPRPQTGSSPASLPSSVGRNPQPSRRQPMFVLAASGSTQRSSQK